MTEPTGLLAVLSWILLPMVMFAGDVRGYSLLGLKRHGHGLRAVWSRTRSCSPSCSRQNGFPITINSGATLHGNRQT